VNELASTAHASYHGLNLTSRVRMNRGLTLTTTYTWSKSIDDISGYTLNSLVNQNPFNRRAEKARSSYDRTHVFSVAWVYDIPGVARYLGNNKVAGSLIDGWELSGMARVTSGAPFNISLGYDNSLTGVGLDRPNVVGSMDLPGGRSRGDQILHWFNPAAFTPAPQGSYGNAGRDIGRGPRSANMDLGLFKNFRVPREHWGTVQFRCEFFSVLNMTMLGTPISNLNAGANFGRINSAGGSRVVQFAMKYLW